MHNCLVIDNGLVAKPGEEGDLVTYLTNGTDAWNVSNIIYGTNGTGVIFDAGSNRLSGRTFTSQTDKSSGDWVVINGYPSDDDSPGTAAEWDALDFLPIDNAENDAFEQHSNATAHSLTIPSTDAIGVSRSAPYTVGALAVAGAAATSYAVPSRRRFFAASQRV